MTIISNFAGWTNFRKLISTLYLFVSLFDQLIFYHQYICIIPHAFPALLITYQNIIQNLFSMPIETYYDQKVPWNFFQGSIELFWTTPVVPWNSMELNQQNRKFHGTFWSSTEFHGIPLNLINSIFEKNHISKYCCWYLIDGFMFCG